MATQHDTENIATQHPLLYPTHSTDAQLALLEAYLKCQLDLNAHHTHPENFIQLNTLHFNALMTVILTQVQGIRMTFAQEHPDAVQPAKLSAAQPLLIRPNRLDGLLEGLMAQVRHIRQTSGVVPFREYDVG